MTKRVESPPGNENRIERRDHIADDLWRISYLNYSVFLHIAAAFDHLPHPLNSSFGDFYTHLGSICDLAEEFLLASHLFVAECRNQPVPVLQALSREEYLEMAANWFDKEYPKAYEHYHNKGKGKPLYLPPRAKIVSGYFGEGDPDLRDYLKFSGQIRQYRNKVVHDVAIGNVLVGKFALVPRKERIQEYAALAAVQAAAKDLKRLKRDFIVREELMNVDLRVILKFLNALWNKPIVDFGTLLYEERNAVVLKKYNLALVETP